MAAALLKKLALAAPLLCAVLVDARRPNGLGRPAPPKVNVPHDYIPIDKSGNALPPINTTYYFDQLIDHADTSKGTFKQRYWHTWEFYEEGGPIILMTPGETNADGE